MLELTPNRLPTLNRWLAVCLCRDLGGYPLAEIAVYFGMGHISVINRCVGKLSQVLEGDPRLARAKKALSQHLPP